MYRSRISLQFSAIRNAARATRRGNAAEAAHWVKVADYFDHLEDRWTHKARHADLHQLKLLHGAMRILTAKIQRD